MTPEKVKEIAKRADPRYNVTNMPFYLEFARLLANEVREEDAKVCENAKAENPGVRGTIANNACDYCAAIIRAMKEGEE